MIAPRLRFRPALLSLALLVVSGLVLAGPVRAQDDEDPFKDVSISATPLGEGLFMLTGAGGNMAVSVGEDGAFLIDDQFAPLTEKIRAAIREKTDQPIRFVLNTHWHGDHTGGNENLGESGSLIVAHENVRIRMSTDQFSAAFNDTVPASPEGALPVVTFTDAVTFHWNGQEIRAFHVEHAHTDGDAIVNFPTLNVIHMGDVYFNGLYPYIDLSAGGSLDGVISAVDLVLGMIDDDTRVVPGHGPLSNKTELRDYRDMLDTVRSRMHTMIKEGKTREEIIALGAAREWDEEWGKTFLNPEQWIGILYDSMTSTSHH